MIRSILVAAVAVAALNTAGCAQLSQITGGDSVGKQILTNLEGCDRTYRGALGAGVSGSFEITCKAAVPAGPVVVPAVAQ